MNFCVGREREGPDRSGDSLIAACSFSQGEWRGSTDICCLMTVTGPEGMAFSYTGKE